MPTSVAPQWSPDGKYICYGEPADGAVQLAVTRADGSDKKVITSKHPHAYSRWSPDALSVSYTRFEKGQPPALWVSAPDGSEAKELLKGVGNPPAEWKPK